MAKQVQPTPEPRTAPVPAHDPLVGVIMINRQHPRFGEPAGISLEEQMTGIFANKPEALAGVGRVVAVDTDHNVIAVAKVTGWARPTAALLPSRNADGFGKKGCCAVGVAVLESTAVGKGLYVETGSGPFFRLRYCAVVPIKQSELIAALGAPHATRSRKAVAATTVMVAEEEYAI